MPWPSLIASPILCSTACCPRKLKKKVEEEEPADAPAMILCAMYLLQMCVNGDVDAARLVLDNGAEVNRAEEDGRTPLWQACYEGQVDAARLLLERGAEVDRATKDV